MTKLTNKTATPEQINKIRDFIKSRIEVADGCTQWTGSLDTQGTPVMRILGDRNFTAVRRVILWMNGIDPTGKLASCKCMNSHCVQEDHIQLMTRKQLQKRTAKVTNYATHNSRRAAIAAKRRKTSKLTPEQVDAIRACGLTTREAAQRYGIAQSTAAGIMAYRIWKDYSNPFAGLMR